MFKSSFRWLRGELLNSFYINAFQDCINSYVVSIRQFLATFESQQLNLQQMTTNTIYSLGHFAGVFLPVLSVGEGYGSMKLTQTRVVDGVQRSERGLLNEEAEDFNFVHTEQDDYADDINTLATLTDRSSLVGNDDELVGYISSTEVNVIDNQGVVKPEKVLTTPPSNVAYSDFYGSKFLYLVDELNESRSIEPHIFIELAEMMQWIRYNGESIETLCKIISIICPNGLVKISSIQKREDIPVFEVFYVYDITAQVTYRTQRLVTFKYIVAQKFPQIVLSEITE